MKKFCLLRYQIIAPENQRCSLLLHLSHFHCVRNCYTRQGLTVEIHMRLKFEGQAIVDEAGHVRFAGQYEFGSQFRIVICRVTREALIARCHLSDPTSEELLAAYRLISDEVNRLASAQFDGGILKPIVTLGDLNNALLIGRPSRYTAESPFPTPTL